MFKVEAEGKPISNQKNSGRCWLFATLNVMRLPFAKSLNIEEFEFSQSYLFFWDKIERCNYFLNNIVETTKRGEAVDGRLVSFLLNVSTLLTNLRIIQCWPIRMSQDYKLILCIIVFFWTPRNNNKLMQFVIYKPSLFFLITILFKDRLHAKKYQNICNFFEIWHLLV